VPARKLLILVAIFFLTSLIGVVTGSTSLITVPVMIEFGIDPHVAVARSNNFQPTALPQAAWFSWHRRGQWSAHSRF
jgi:uncharacterized membrane protein YfcA